MRFAYAGTPEFAARVLSHLDEMGRRPVLVLSQPDRPKGRGRKTAPPEVVGAAAGLGVPCVQVHDINSDDALSALQAAKVSTLVVAAFGQILRTELLQRYLCINIHASLLPAYRGAAPIERAIAAGESCTGVSIMRMTEGLDEGPWAVQRMVTIDRRDDAGSLGRSLAVLGAVTLDQVLTGLEDGNVLWNEQRGTPSYAAKLGSADGVFDPALPASILHDRVRSLAPGVGTRMAVGDLGLKVWRSWPHGGEGLDMPTEGAAEVAGRAGVISVDQDRLFVGCVEGVLEILELQPAGKARMKAAEFLRGYASRVAGMAVVAGAGNRSAAKADPSAATDASRPYNEREAS